MVVDFGVNGCWRNKKNVKQKKSKITMQTYFNFSKVKSYPYDDLEGLSDWFDQAERQYPTGEFDTKVRVLVLASPTKLQVLAESAVEQYCDEWGANRHREFRERYGQHADIYDDQSYGGRLFETPYKKRPTRVLDDAEEGEPDYGVVRSKVLQAVLGSEGAEKLEDRLEKQQGNTSIQMYISEFKSVIKTLAQIHGGVLDERRYVKYFIRGLNPALQPYLQLSGRNDDGLESLFVAAVAASDRAALFMPRALAWSPAAVAVDRSQNKFQIHESRKTLFESTPKAVVRSSLFAVKLETSASDPVLVAFVYGLNAVSASAEYLQIAADAGRLRLDETAALLSSTADLEVLHNSLLGALKNVSSSAQLEKVLQACFPRQFRMDRVEPRSPPLPAPKTLGVRGTEALNAVQGELLNFKNDIFEKLRDAQKTQMNAQTNFLERLNAAEQMGRGSRGSRRDGERGGYEPRESDFKKFQDNILEKLNSVQQSNDTNKRKWEAAFEDRNKRARDEDRRGAPREVDGRGGRDSRQEVLKCYNCGKEGHRKLECPDNGLCKFCRKPGHAVEDCETRKAHVCKECGNKGHSPMWCKPRDCKQCNKKHSLLNGCRL